MSCTQNEVLGPRSISADHMYANATPSRFGSLPVVHSIV